MLSELRIENVAVIEKANVTFGNGLNVLTGETGAGKSILIDSINAILGNRTSRELVRSYAPKACIWATFTNLDDMVKEQLANAGYPVEDDALLLYREIHPDGKSSCRVNGMLATAAVVREICGSLIAIHGQHDSQSLMNPAKHLGILDAFAQNQTLHDTYYPVYRQLVTLKKQIDAMNLDEDEKEKRLEMLRFRIQELEQLNLQPDEEQTLQQQRDELRNAQTLKEKLAYVYAVLNGDEDTAGAVQMLGDAANSMTDVGEIAHRFSAFGEKLNDLYYTAQELASDVNSEATTIEDDAVLLDTVEERLDTIYRLKQKYNVSANELPTVLQNAKEELDNIEFADQKIDELYEKQEVLYKQAKDLAEKLTVSRKEAFAQFNLQISDALQFLNMPGIHFELQHKEGPLASSGQDTVEFYISTNAGEAAKPLAKIASGGELSRIMLAVKSTLADKDDISTVIYDEIDTGVSGLAAGRIGEKLKQTAIGRQVICITHSAQIAAMANEHLLIKKNIENERTYTEIHPLDTQERVEELAKMVSGDKVTQTTLASAQELLQNSQ